MSFKDIKEKWCDESKYDEIISVDLIGYYTINEVKKENPNIFDNLVKLNTMKENIFSIQSQQVMNPQEIINGILYDEENRRFFIELLADSSLNIKKLLESIEKDCEFIVVDKHKNILISSFYEKKKCLYLTTYYDKTTSKTVIQTHMFLDGSIEYAQESFFDKDEDIFYYVFIASKRMINNDSISNRIIENIINNSF